MTITEGDRWKSFTGWAIAFLAWGSSTSQAHLCGPTRIELRVGEACAWKITADLTEVDSRYSPVLEGPRGVAEVTPLINFQARHGDFVVVGKAPGTNILGVAWSYQPTGAAGFCDVQIVVVANTGGGEAFQSPQRSGLLAARSGAIDISASDLRLLLDGSIPAVARKLLVFTQCYGGSIAMDAQFVDAPNIAIASATSPNQTGKYGGYHDDAARALRPMAGGTALDLHQVASQGKMTVAPAAAAVGKLELLNNSEWTRSAGGLSLAEFSLEPVTVAGPVKSRHVVIFMGQPEKKQVLVQTHNGDVTIPSPQGAETGIDDVADRDTILNNFRNQPNTTVRTAGGQPSTANPSAGQNGWDYPGDYTGLRRALREAGEAIRNSPDPAAEQFILFVGDHGSEALPLASESKDLAAGGVLQFKVSLDGLTGKLGYLNDLHLSYDNQPNITVEVTPGPGGGAAPQSFPALANQPRYDLQIELTVPDGPPIVLSESIASAFDHDDNGILSAERGEHATLQFPLDEGLLVRKLLAAPFDVRIRNRAQTGLTVRQIYLSTGAISKPAFTIPPPIITGVGFSGVRRLELTANGPTGQAFELMMSTDLVRWTRVRTALFDKQTIQMPIDTPANSGEVFYRFEKVLPRLP